MKDLKNVTFETNTTQMSHRVRDYFHLARITALVCPQNLQLAESFGQTPSAEVAHCYSSVPR